MIILLDDGRFEKRDLTMKPVGSRNVDRFDSISRVDLRFKNSIPFRNTGTISTKCISPFCVLSLSIIPFPQITRSCCFAPHLVVTVLVVLQVHVVVDSVADTEEDKNSS